MTVTAGMLGSRGLRSHSAPARPVPARPEPPPAPAIVPTAPPRRRASPWTAPLAGVAIGWLIASVLSAGFGVGRERGLFYQVLAGGVIFAVMVVLRQRRERRVHAARPMAAAPSPVVSPVPDAMAERQDGDRALDEGLLDIRRMDPKFDPTRFIGYIEMVFRGTQAARMSRDVASLRDRVTPELYRDLTAQSDRLGSLGHAIQVGEIEVRAQVTEAWHEDGRDYLTAYVAGTMLESTVDERTGAVVDGSQTVPGAVEAFWTFSRPGGLNPWMLSAIQTS